jgi:hypothetical protein
MTTEKKKWMGTESRLPSFQTVSAKLKRTVLSRAQINFISNVLWTDSLKAG